MLRAAIYARFSTELQNERSIDDQIALCRAHASRQELAVVATYHDSARSGASMIGRTGLLDLMDAANKRTFDVVVVEALDRLSRDMEDLAGIHKRLSFAGIEIRAVHDGTADSILVGIRGLVGQMQREDGAKKVRRGMAGVLRDGRHPGGRAYGYRPIPGQRGELEIVESEAQIIRRIFGEYLDGQRPRAIAMGLNRDGIPPPRGSKWNASTINGNATRGHGIIINDIYAGRMVWNRVRMVKNPDTGRRVSRANPRSEWQTADAPHLRIIDPETFERAQALKAERAVVPTHHLRQPKHPLAGLLRCGSCGSGMTAYGSSPSGRRRIRCTAMYESGTCQNKRSVYLAAVEHLVFDGMREQLRDPRLIEVFVRRYNAERAKAASEASSVRGKLESQIARVAAERQRMVDLVVRQVIEEADGGHKLRELAAERDELQAKLAALGVAPAVIVLHPATIDRYLTAVDRLATKLADRAASPDSRGAVDEMRELIQCVTVHATHDRPLRVEVKGRLAALVSADPVGLRMVAEDRYRRYTHASTPDRMTFGYQASASS